MKYSTVCLSEHLVSHVHIFCLSSSAKSELFNSLRLAVYRSIVTTPVGRGALGGVLRYTHGVTCKVLAKLAGCTSDVINLDSVTKEIEFLGQ